MTDPLIITFNMQLSKYNHAEYNHLQEEMWTVSQVIINPKRFLYSYYFVDT